MEKVLNLKTAVDILWLAFRDGFYGFHTDLRLGARSFFKGWSSLIKLDWFIYYLPMWFCPLKLALFVHSLLTKCPMCVYYAILQKYLEPIDLFAACS